MIKAKNIRVQAYKGEVICVLDELSPEDWNAKAAKSRKSLYLELYGMDPIDDTESKRAIDKYFKGK